MKLDAFAFQHYSKCVSRSLRLCYQYICICMMCTVLLMELFPKAVEEFECVIWVVQAVIVFFSGKILSADTIYSTIHTDSYLCKQLPPNPVYICTQELEQ